jgi:phenylalanyl-tRNA synthetase beta chain
MIAFKVFLGVAKPPKVRLATKVPQISIKVDPSASQIRPFVVAAVLRGIKFTPSLYRSFIDCQDKLHQNLCRRRTLVAIGTHDLDLVEGQVRYDAVVPEKIQFVPLKQSVSMNGTELMEFYKTHPDLKEYCRIIRDSPVYPLISDSKGVLSLPPIINSERTKISLNTKNVFIEMTANDLTKANVCLNTFVTAFSQYCAEPFTVEPVAVEYLPSHLAASVAGQTIIYPNLETRSMEVPLALIKAGVNPRDDTLNGAKIVDLLNRMCCPSTLKGETVQVEVPVFRSDIMHACDVVEDVCIAYGFGNIVPETAKTLGNPKQQPINKLSDMLRQKMAMCGYDECLTWSLCSEKENFQFMAREEAPSIVPTERVKGYALHKEVPVRLSNPKTKEFEIVRTSLLPGLLKVVASNKHNPVPIKLFEVGDVVFQVRGEGAVNERRLAAIFAGKTSGFELKHGVLNAIMRYAGYALDEEIGAPFNRITNTYRLRESNYPSFLKQMQGEVVIDDVVVGVVGVVHPNVLNDYGIDFAVCSAIELDLEVILEKILLEKK